MIGFIRATALADFSAFASSQGLQPAKLLLRSGLPVDLEQLPDSLIPYGKMLDLLVLCEMETGNPLFALQYGLFQGVNVFGPLLYLLRNAKDLREALSELVQYYRVHSGAATVGLEEQGKHAFLTYTISDTTVPGYRQGSELAVGVGMQLMRTLLGNRWSPQALLFQHAQIAEPAQYRRLVDLSPRFNTPYNGWMFAADLLDTPLASADPALHRLIREHLDYLAHMTAEELPTLVQQLIRSFMPEGRASIEYIAAHMMLSTRKLQRRLDAEGTSFQELLSMTRQSMACHYLQDSALSIAQLADLLGYGDQSAFSRAFQRWYGTSPREWRKQLPSKAGRLQALVPSAGDRAS
ncbi:AraC family transcriptional regulator [Aquipseudomonas ullengensis]|uniref:AraC family transcriptional regulator n=1 Tax=Aquipseudomonas ullengensis TaxID=2759166 RepID=A0A7W4LKK8_9GAMM|nr:AraC family transcriptional regulator [Pseudomonas ullengensis]MBB2494722.1 AraC family transcriptional regulator [Pseudomonas ullengensis]